MKQAFLIPVYRHGATLRHVVDQLVPYNLPIIIVDDGNDEENKAFIAQVVKEVPLCQVVTLSTNSGKGKAVSAGIIAAHEQNITHVLQIDADGQHDTSRCSFFLEQSACHPEALICGYPEFDESVPSHRKKGRQFGNRWTQIVAWNPDIKDSMCGFRVYPVDQLYHIICTTYLDSYMSFDTEILVRLSWKNVPMLFYPVKVVYPKNGTSNFHVVKDNIRLSWMFTRLCCGMLLRVPLLSYRALKKRLQA